MSFFDFLFPTHCLGCGKPGQYFCSVCQTKLRPVSQICPVCEQPSVTGLTHSLCQSSNSLQGLTCLFAFEGIVRQAIHQLKYGLVTDLAPELISIILRELKKQTGLKKFIEQSQPIVLPIPLYWYKENQRGFNQATLFGQAIAQEFKLPFSEKVLKRKRATPSQTTLSGKERKENVKNAFAVSPLVHGSWPNILLVDDVWTTGATLKTAASLLKKSGAKRVWGLTIAR